MGKKLVNHIQIFMGVINGTLKLCAVHQEPTLWASWKVDGQEFYIYAKKNNWEEE